MIFFEMTVLQFWRFLDPMVTYFCSSESNVVSFDYILLSSQVLRCDLRRCVMRQGVRQKKHRSPSSWHELCRLCRWDPHFCQVFGAEIWVGVTDTHSWFTLICWICFGSRVYNWWASRLNALVVLMDDVWGTQLRVWFQLPENCLGGDTRSGH